MQLKEIIKNASLMLGKLDVVKYLENEKNETLKYHLCKAIEEYSFQEVSTDKKPELLPRAIVGIIASLVSGILLKKVLHFNIWITIGVAIAIVLGVMVQYAKELDNYTNNQKEKVCSEYVKQLKYYKETLVNICEKYEK